MASGTGLPWRLKHLITFEGIFGVVTREKFVPEQPFPQGVTEFIGVSNQVTSELLEKAHPMLRRGRWRHVKADVWRCMQLAEEFGLVLRRGDG